VHQVQKKKKKKEKRHKKKRRKEKRAMSQKEKKKRSIFWCHFPFDVGDDSRTNPFKERGNDENQ
jgi:hypothetical protein